MSNKNLAIIPARGNSRRIPRKNIRHFLGKPIVAYSIEAAFESGIFEKVMVSTDDLEIAAVAKEYGAEVPFWRSAKNSDDFASTADVIEEVFESYREKGEEFDRFCCLYPTAPFVSSKRLKEGYDLLEKFDSVIPIVSFSYPVWRSFRLTESNTIGYKWPEFEKSRSQDLEKLYHDAGQWYWMKTSVFNKSLLTKNTGSVILSDLEVQDIDTEEDWKVAEWKYEYLQSIK